MQFLKGLFWVLLAVIVAVFAIGNWTSVPIKLWGGLIAEVNLPILLVVVFFAGMLPVLLYHHAVRWRLRQRLTVAERSLADLRTAPPAGTAPPVMAAGDIDTSPAAPKIDPPGNLL